MALEGFERKALHAILHEEGGSQAGYVDDSKIAEIAHHPIEEVRDCLETLEAKKCVERSPVVGGYSAYITAKGRQELRRSQVIGGGEGVSTKSPLTVVPEGSAGAPLPRSAATQKTTVPIRLFYSYSHKDEELRKELEDHLSLLRRQGVISGWHDQMIGAGEEWRGKLDKNLDEAQIILLLISPSFLASDYCYDIETKRALDRHDKVEATVIPILLRPVDWEGQPPETPRAAIVWRSDARTKRGDGSGPTVLTTLSRPRAPLSAHVLRRFRVR